MNFLIDTHIFLWALADPARLSTAQRSALEDLANTVHVSAVTVVELMIKASIGRLRIDFDPVATAKESGFALLDFTAGDGLLLRDLPFHHKDPFDRMLIAQSLATRYPIMTEDPKIKLYACETM
jgi:PIN domain nuclease of toxin-antitoxin system